MLLSFFDLFHQAVNQTGRLSSTIGEALTTGVAPPQEEERGAIANLREIYRELAERMRASRADEEVSVRARERSWEALSSVPLDLETILNAAQADRHWCISRATEILRETDDVGSPPGHFSA